MKFSNCGSLMFPIRDRLENVKQYSSRRLGGVHHLDAIFVMLRTGFDSLS